MGKRKGSFFRIQKKKPRNASVSALITACERQLSASKQLLEIAKRLYSIFDFQALIETLLYICMYQMHVSGAAVYIHKSFHSDFFVLEEGYNALCLDEPVFYSIPASHPLIDYLAKADRPHTVGELSALFEGSEPVQQFGALKTSLIVPIRQRTTLNGILLLGERIGQGMCPLYDTAEKEHIMAIASFAANAINIVTLIEMSTIDVMTHLKLKHYFCTVLTDKLEFSAVERLPLCLLMIDIDYFKNVNDTYGHIYGDSILQQVSKIIFEAIRGQDMAGRYGGDEFIVMLYDTDKNAAFLVAERIRRAVEEHCFECRGIRTMLTVSAGLSVFVPGTTGTTVRDLIDQADRALYESKRRGKNRISVFTPRPSESNVDTVSEKALLYRTVPDFKLEIPV